MKRITTIFWLLVLSFQSTCFAQEIVSVSRQDNPTQILLTALFTALATALISIFGYLGKLVGKWLNKKILDIDNDIMQKAAYVSVRFVEDAFKDMSGNDKFKRACEQVAAKLPGVSHLQIEEAVRAMYVNFSAEIPKN